MRITLHRPHQIGGCITEIESNAGTRIFIDLGHLLPDGDKPSEDKLATNEAIDKLTAGAAAILYTHNHGDHVELFNLVDESIPQYIGNLAADLMGRKYQRLSHLDDQHLEYLDRLKKLANFHFYQAGKPIFFGEKKDIKVTPFYVSHSATDSYLLKIQCDHKTVIHTGDFREHGYLGDGLRKVIDKFHIAGRVDVLIIEGTNVGQPYKSVESEQDVCDRFKEIMSMRKNVFVLCSSQDADRLESVYQATYATKPWRPFVCDSFQAETMTRIAKAYQGLGPHYQFEKEKVYVYYDNAKLNKGLVSKMKECGFTMLIRNSLTFTRWLGDILQFCKKEETSFVYSMYHGYVEKGWGGYNEKAEAFIQPLLANSTPCLKSRHKYDYNHTSGHASVQSLKEICEFIGPKTAIIPIHHNPKADFHTIGLRKDLDDKIVEADTIVDGITISFNKAQ